LALTFGTLLSSQGAGAHRYWASRPFSGQLAKRYSAGFAVSNPEVWPHHPHITPGRGIRGVGGMGARPVRRSTGVRGVEHGRRAVAVESNPLSPLSRTAVRCPRRLSSMGAVEPTGKPAAEHGPGRNRPRRPHFARPERAGRTRADPEAVTTVHPDRTRHRRHELPPAVRRSDARHHSGGSATETNIRPSIPTDDRHRMFPAAGSGRRGRQTGRCPGMSLPVLAAGSLGRSRRRAPMRSASRVVRPATTLPGVYSGPAPGFPTARTGERFALSP
jgi:hypothetical protein